MATKTVSIRLPSRYAASRGNQCVECGISLGETQGTICPDCLDKLDKDDDRCLGRSIYGDPCNNLAVYNGYCDDCLDDDDDYD
ncbi:MAG: hypothetical protein OXH94_11535 [Rhodospirillales bacterium]|nr:hypothetical protein [Rhodospirillales bacterium]